MNLLIDKLPTEYEGLKVDTNFRSFILFELLMQDNTIDETEKIFLAIRLFFKEPIDDIRKMLNAILWFYRCGEEENITKNIKEGENKKQKQIYSFEYDSKLIYSAFWSQYKLDLNEVDYLHWFKFRAMFDGLNDGNRICEIMSYRAIDLSQIKDKETKKKYRKLQRQFALPDNRTVEEKEKDFADSLW